MRSLHAFISLVLLSAVLGACATYEPLPLEEKATLASGLPAPLNADSVLTMADVTKLTLELNPDLKTARNDHQLAKAQIVQAGILPNPQFNGSYAFLLGGPAAFNAFALALTEDIKALIIRDAARNSAEYDAHKVDAGLMWQEWQTISKAQLLYVDLVEMQKQRDLMSQNQQLFSSRYAKSHQALLRGDIDLTVEAPDLSVLSDATKQLADLDRQIQGKWQELDALLGLEPNVRLHLSNNIIVVQVDRAKVRQILPDLPKLRPDLIALQYGYQSQEEKLRGAILGQFPALLFGGNYGSDTSHVYSGGPTVTFDLPIFNHNQGNIAIEQATRQQVHDDYTNRLNAADSEIKAMLDSRDLLQKQYAQIQKNMPDIVTSTANAENAFRFGNIDERSYVDIKTAQLNQKQQAINLEQSLLEQQVALATLIGVNMPVLQLTTEDNP